MSAPPTSGSGSSSSPTEDNWPTPRASDGPGESAHNRTWSSTDYNLHSAIRNWPTPRANEGSQQNSENAGMALSKAAPLWPTPSVTEPGFPAGKFVDRDGRRPTHAAQRLFDPESGTYRQKGLTQAAQIAGLWPTPVATEAEKAGPSADRRRDDTLTKHAEKWPTPQTSDAPGIISESAARLREVPHPREQLRHGHGIDGTQRDEGREGGAGLLRVRDEERPARTLALTETMRVLLVDVDSKIDNFALMRAATYHRERGDDVVLSRHRVSRDRVRMSFELGAEGPWDLAYVSCVFVWNRPAAEVLARSLEAGGARVLRGGTGYDWGRKREDRAALPPEVDRCAPDYSLYGHDYAIGYCQRGCVRLCEFCDVPRSEGPMRDHPFNHPSTWVPEGMRRAMLLDNEFAVQPDDVQRDVVGWFRDHGIRYVLSQGYDIREVAKRPGLARIVADNLPYDNDFDHHRLFIAWDYPGIEPAVRLGLRALLGAGIAPRKVTCYVLGGFIQDPREDHKWLRRRFDVLWGEFGVLPFVMPYNNRKDDAWLNAFARYANRGPAAYRNHTFEDYLAAHPIRGQS
jgi:hypothetical protein